ncbi:hypothetical protein [Ureibacillus chungkukjangi]|uniref:hypothetical protein n=1 Tax=Ureibacillus chungkukjangi TaxID=1202712 RepID=UPI00203B270E|nr:hypothetical protein [Ureibacillus chungkukjangi]
MQLKMKKSSVISIPKSTAFILVILAGRQLKNLSNAIQEYGLLIKKDPFFIKEGAAPQKLE